jgi:DNA-binding LytR/AlgR family response regulator
MQPPVREGLPAAVHASPSAGTLRGRVRRGMSIGTMAALVLAFTGAFDTDQIALGPRLAYWLGVVLAGSALGLVITWAVQAWGGLARWRWAEIGLASLLIALPLTFIVVVASAITFGPLTITAATVLGFFTVVFPISLVMTLINWTTAAKEGQALAPEQAPEAPVEPAAEPTRSPAAATLPAGFAERLPEQLRSGRLIALAAEDHYLRVFTDQGNDLVLMRMADAVTLLADVPGARVHRSWWVARAAVTGTTRDGDRMVLMLENGLCVPVSRTERPKLAAAGWF